MTKDEAPRFGQALATLGIVCDRQLEQELVSAYWAVLKKYTIEEVETAISRCIEECKFFPKPVEIIERIPFDMNLQHVGADEAWAIALLMYDENETVVVTDEIRYAWSVALPVMDVGDEVGARMAFKDAYHRLNKNLPPKWSISPGIDKALRSQRVSEAVSLGRLPKTAMELYPQLEAPNMEALTHGLNDHLRLAARDGAIVCELEKAKANIAKIQAMLAGGYAATTSDERVAKAKATKEEQLKRALGEQ